VGELPTFYLAFVLSLRSKPLLGFVGGEFDQHLKTARLGTLVGLADYK